VLFSQGIQTILNNEGCILLEVGPSNVLSVLVKQHPGKIPAARVITSWDHAANEHSALKCTLSALGKLWQFNSNINWHIFYSQETRRRISLPGYPFERKRFWIEPATATDEQRQIPISTRPQNHMAAQQEILMAPQKSPSETSPDTHAPLSRKANIALELRKLLKELSGMDLQESDDASSFLSLGLDSLFLTQVIGKLKKNFNAELKFRQLLEEYTDINSLTDYLDQKIPPEMFRPTAALSPQQSKTSKELSPSLFSQNIAIDQPLPIPMQGAGNSVLENVITQQLQIMQQQLSMLRGQEGMPIHPNAMPAPAPSQPEKGMKLEQSNLPADEKESAQAKTSSPKAFGASVRIEKSSQTTFNPNQKKFFADFCKKYLEKTRRSKECTILHRPHLADPRVVSGFNPLIKELVYPIIVNRSSGSRVWDIDGNEYIDMVNGFGANLLGHSPGFITEAIHHQLLQGIEIGPQHPLAGEVAELICEFSGLERAVFCNTGSEAVLGAMRISRTVTGRDKIVVFADDYHGMFDEVIVRGTNSLKSVPAASGIPSSSVENMLVLEYGKEKSLDIITQHADDIAAILVEPVQSRNLNLQPREFLHRLRDVTLEKKIVLIFDEVITGFRSHLHGAQAYFGVRADIATYGKIVGGGMPIGVIAGKAKYMDALDGGMWQYGDASVPEAGVTYFAGTFVRHPLALAAAKATLEYLKKCGGSLQEELNNKTARFVADMKDFLVKSKAPINILHFSSALQFAFTEDTPANNLFYPMLRDKGIHIFPGRTWFFTTAHDQSDFTAVSHALQETVRELQQTGFLSGDPTPVPNPKQKAVNSLGLSTTPPVSTARLGKTPDGNPAWFIPDPRRPGKYMKFE
jgi:glutamate-1-semialdehyde aminotransferase/acyl carrier protein